MTPERWLADRIKDKGLMQRRLVEKANIPGFTNQKLSASLTGRRRIKVNEFVAVCIAADINPLECPIHEVNRSA